MIRRNIIPRDPKLVEYTFTPSCGLSNMAEGVAERDGYVCTHPSMSAGCIPEDVLHTLTGAMSLLRRCRVNAALTIQLFSQLFHFINMWLFNKLVTDKESGLCCHYWGAILRQQLSHIEAWAEKQGLELAADCHLSRIVQVSLLLPGCVSQLGRVLVHWLKSRIRFCLRKNG